MIAYVPAKRAGESATPTMSTPVRIGRPADRDRLGLLMGQHADADSDGTGERSRHPASPVSGLRVSAACR